MLVIDNSNNQHAIFDSPGRHHYLLTRVDSGYNNGVQLCLTNTGTSSSPAYTLSLQDCANGSGPIDNLWPTTISAAQMAQYDPSGSGWVTVKLDVNGDRYTAFLGQPGSTAVPMVEQFTLLDGFGRLASMGPTTGYTGSTVGWGSCLFSIPATAPGYNSSTGKAYVIRNLSMSDIQPPNWTDVIPTSDLTAVANSDGSIDLSWQNKPLTTRCNQISYHIIWKGALMSNSSLDQLAAASNSSRSGSHVHVPAYGALLTSAGIVKCIGYLGIFISLLPLVMAVVTMDDSRRGSASAAPVVPAILATAVGIALSVLLIGLGEGLVALRDIARNSWQ